MFRKVLRLGVKRGEKPPLHILHCLENCSLKAFKLNPVYGKKYIRPYISEKINSAIRGLSAARLSKVP
jgi:hypothetical protein